jgi:hypothetical protein
VAKCWGEALYFIYTPPPLVSGRMTNCDKRGGAFCRSWLHDPGLKGVFAREPRKGNFPSLVPGGVTTTDKRPPFCLGS